MTANVLSPHIKKGNRPKVEDFMLKFAKKKSKRMSDADLMRALRRACGRR